MNRPLRVLLVEDQENDALLTLRMLREGGYAPSSLRAETAQALAVALETQPWDIVLCDYNLPQYDGAEALALVRSRAPNLPVIFVTGTLGDEAAVRLIKSGAYDYVLKDRLARLPTAVDQALREADARRVHEETQRALHDTAKQLGGVLEAAQDAIFEIDAAGTIKLANEAAHRLFGWPPGSLLNQPLSAIVPPEHRERQAAGLRRFLETGESAVIGHVTEVTALRRDGTRLCCEVSLSSLTHYSGERRFVGILRDVTERKQAERHLAVQYAVTQVLADSPTIEEAGAKIVQVLCECLGWEVGSIWKVDGAANLLRCIDIWHVPQMEAAEFMADSRRRTFAPGVGMPGRVWSRGEPVWVPDVLKDSNFPRAPLAAKAGLHAAVGFPIKIGKRVYGIIEFFHRAIRNPDVPALHLVGDIGIKIGQFIERREAEEAIRRANERLNALIRSSPMAIGVLDVEGRVELWNPAAERLFGWTEAEILGRPLPTVPPDKRDEHEALRRQVLTGQSIVNQELRRQCKNGTAVLVSLSVAPLHDRHGVMTGMLGIMADITERKLLEVRAQRLDRLATLGQMLSGIAHELKNPLFVITGRLYLLKEKLRGQPVPEIESDVAPIAEAAERMTKVVERFLQMARPTPQAMTVVSMEQVVRQTLDFLAHELLKHQITVVRDFAPDLPRIRTDPNQIQGVFLNLILNAMQAMAEAHGRGTLTVNARLVTDGETRGRGDGERWIEVRIQDDGPGISPEHREKLFEPFFTTKEPGKGTGLGLWIVRSTVVALQGTVACEAEVGQGATFIVRLPATEKATG